ncbi:AraC family transcriptional regulator [Dyadobacter frigoris]|uniref:AraC family transcriptional regulator n=1 Tax=Dyadobacter frigoris TaxID=2576211 RepID=UPI0024A0F705|nr:AraC family transcriptional regulator [Dyadobacter frigoris]GLU55230.1 AraC family transcriptional regulator [Dyadobacter frigoris]
MSKLQPESKTIDLHQNIPDLLNVTWDRFDNWSIRVLRRNPDTCTSYISPNRREFYKVMYFTKGIGMFSLGLNNFYIDQPTIVFVHPNEIISWKRLTYEADGYICFFKKNLAEENPALKFVIDKYKLFSDPDRSVVRLSDLDVQELDGIFKRMYDADTKASDAFAEDTIVANLQLLMIASLKKAAYVQPDTITDEFKHVHDFFQLLEKETSTINYTSPIQIKTAQEFADKLSIHPNHLNALLKKHTGQNVSSLIKSRLIEESKVLLIQTDWTVQNVGFAVGFAEQPNFSQFFKKNTGYTPADFRKNNLI